MKYAVVQTGGKQYLALEGQAIEVDRLPHQEGDSLELKEVLLAADDGQVLVGSPFIEGAKVKASVVAQVKGPKVRVFKYIPKERYRRRAGHRQLYTRLAIESIILPGGQAGAEEVEGHAAPLAELRPKAKPKPTARKAEGRAKPAAKPAKKPTGKPGTRAAGTKKPAAKKSK
ncbi:MAG: 50S ribosomal protein L21 [Chloroflexota bacterium]